MDDLFNKLTAVSKGADVRSVATEERMNVIQDLIKRLWAGENIREESGQFISRGSDGVGFRFRKRRGGGGGASVSGVPSLFIVESKPAYVPAPAGDPASGVKRVWITLGACRHVAIGNYSTHYDLSVSTKFYVKARLWQTGALRVRSAEIVSYADADDTNPPDPEWGANGERPEYVYALLGSVFKTETSEGSGEYTWQIWNDGKGSMMVYEYNTGIVFDQDHPVNTTSCVNYSKSIVMIRSFVNYT